MTRHPDDELLEGAEGLADGVRAELLLHLRDCADCRARWTAREPSQLFGLLALVPPPDAALEELSRRVEAAASRPRRFSLAMPAALAASLLLAGLLGAYVWLRPPVPGTSVAERSRIGFEQARGVRDRDAIEVLSPATAEVVNFSVGDTRVVMIFDGELDL